MIVLKTFMCEISYNNILYACWSVSISYTLNAVCVSLYVHVDLLYICCLCYMSWYTLLELIVWLAHTYIKYMLLIGGFQSVKQLGKDPHKWVPSHRHSSQKKIYLNITPFIGRIPKIGNQYTRMKKVIYKMRISS